MHAFVSALESAGHTVSVVLPHQQRSWIGKAHFVSQLVKPTRYYPSDDPYDGGEGSTTDSTTPPSTNKSNTESKQPWYLVDGTPASAVQLGLFHLFPSSIGKFDLVLSGPNYGRNATSLFALSSGTIGGAMEAATFGIRAIALSFAFFKIAPDKQIIGEACQHAIKVRVPWILDVKGVGLGGVGGSFFTLDDVLMKM